MDLVEDKMMICECGNKKDKAVFKCCRPCLNKLYKKVYDKCIECNREKITEREKEFNRCFACFQNFKNM